MSLRHRLRRADAIGLTVVAATLLLPLRGLLRAEGGPMEEGFMLVFAERVLAGDVPNVDFLHLYGPGALWVLAGAFEVFGVSILVERLVAFSQQLLLVLGVFAVLRHWNRTVATAGAVTSVLLVTTPIGLVALPWVGGVGLVLWGLYLALRAAPSGPWGERRAADRWVVAGGVLCGLGLLFRPDLVLAVGAGGLVLWFASRPRQRGRWLAGVAAGSAPMLIHLARAGPVAAFEGMVIDPVFRLRPGRNLPSPPDRDDLDGFLQRIAELDALDWPAPFTSPEQIWLWFWLLLGSTALLMVGGALGVRRDPGDWRARLLLLSGAFCVGILPQAVQRPDTTHLAWVSCVTVALLPAALLSLARPWRDRLPGGTATVTSVVALAVVLALLIPFFTLRRYADYSLQTFDRSRRAVALTHDGRTFYYGRPEVAAFFDDLAADVDERTEAGDRLFVGPADLSRTAYVDSFIYHLFPDLVPATYYIEMDPGVADRPGSGLAEDLASADVAVLATLWDDWVEPNASVESGSQEPNRVLQERFCLVDTYGDLEGGTEPFFELWERCR